MQEEAASVANPQLEVTKSFSLEAFVANQNARARQSLGRHLPRPDGSVVVVSSDVQAVSRHYSQRWSWLLYSGHAFYAYTLVTGTLPLTLTVAYPFLAFYRIFC